jgi:pimeloyl-ACP methyl ester carboxylesterase
MTVVLPQGVDSRVVDLDGPVHYLDYGGPAAGPLVVGVHGLGGAAWNWAALAPRLVDRVRLIAVDLAGHGRTPARGRGTTVPDNRRLLDRFLREVAGEPVVLVGNSMGGMISVLEAARSPELVSGLVLVDAALPRPLRAGIDLRVASSFAVMSIPGIGEAALERQRRRRTPEQQVRETLALCSVDAARIPDDVVRLGVELAEERASNSEFSAHDFLDAARSVVRLVTGRRRLTAALDRVRAPVLVIHGDRDRLVPVDVARLLVRRRPHWRLAVATDVGHVPQLEVPDWTAETIRAWLVDEGLVSR